ncbi:unnamed protein product [Chilo suppressalis]|uniref:Uncharacterized protein n=1 Tax=Chilo suppressalis TaxID=168631 RepID=A0ABN8B7R0_CHISP|nr:unnamed protein product [Chilo suppressalis]
MLSCLVRTKSTMESTRASMLPAYRLYAAFCRETTLHGVKHTVEPRVHYCERILWFALTLSAFFGAVYCGISQWSRYNSDPVVVAMQRDYRRWWSAFPAITACFMDRIDPERARGVIENNWNVTEESDPERYDYYQGFLDLITDVSFRTNLQNFWKYQNDESVRGIDLMELAMSVHPMNMLKVVVSSANGENMYWTPVMTEVGICLAFNSLYAKYQYIEEDDLWKSPHLQQFHYLSGQCYIRVISLSKSVRYFIHSPYEIPTAISNPTGEVSPGDELVIDFKEVEILASEALRQLRPDQRRCRYSDEWISNSIRAYSFGLCQMHCRNRMALMFCGCRPYFYAKGGGGGACPPLGWVHLYPLHNLYFQSVPTLDPPLLEPLPALEGTLSRLIPAASAVVITHQSTLNPRGAACLTLYKLCKSTFKVAKVSAWLLYQVIHCQSRF